MRREEKIELILKHLGNNGWVITQEDKDKLYNRKGKIKSHLSGCYNLGKKKLCKTKDYIWFYTDDTIDVEENDWQIKIIWDYNDLVLPNLYHMITLKDNINFACKDYIVNLTHINTEEEIADIVAQYEEKISQVQFKIKEYETKIREQKMKKDF